MRYYSPSGNDEHARKIVLQIIRPPRRKTLVGDIFVFFFYLLFFGLIAFLIGIALTFLLFAS